MASEEESNAYEATMGTGVRATFVELSRVIWPTREELLRYTSVVIGFLLVIAGFIAVVDFGLTKVSNFLYGSN
jgi:preprotein translocase subunit SecE